MVPVFYDESSRHTHHATEGFTAGTCCDPQCKYTRSSSGCTTCTICNSCATTATHGTPWHCARGRLTVQPLGKPCPSYDATQETHTDAHDVASHSTSRSGQASQLYVMQQMHTDTHAHSQTNYPVQSTPLLVCVVSVMGCGSYQAGWEPQQQSATQPTKQPGHRCLLAGHSAAQDPAVSSLRKPFASRVNHHAKTVPSAHAGTQHTLHKTLGTTVGPGPTDTTSCCKCAKRVLASMPKRTKSKEGTAIEVAEWVGQSEQPR